MPFQAKFLRKTICRLFHRLEAYSARNCWNNCAHSVKSMKLGMVVDDNKTFLKILGGNFLKSKWPPKSKMAAIIYSFTINCCNISVYCNITLKTVIIVHIQIKLPTSMIHLQIKLQNGRQNPRWPPRSYILIRNLQKK